MNTTDKEERSSYISHARHSKLFAFPMLSPWTRSRMLNLVLEAIRFPHTQPMQKESNAGLGTLRYLPLETRRKVCDLLLFDTCTEHTKRRTIREFLFTK